MDRNPGLLEDVERSILCQARKLVDFVADELSQSENQARERAHLATCGDRPFAGCNPCQPGDVDVPLSGTATNRAAVPRPDAGE